MQGTKGQIMWAIVGGQKPLYQNTTAISSFGIETLVGARNGPFPSLTGFSKQLKEQNHKSTAICYNGLIFKLLYKCIIPLNVFLVITLKDESLKWNTDNLVLSWESHDQADISLEDSTIIYH